MKTVTYKSKLRNHALYHTIDIIDGVCKPIFERLNIVNQTLRTKHRMRFKFNFNYQIEPFGEHGHRIINIKFILEIRPDDPHEFNVLRDSIYTSIFHVGERNWDDDSITHILRCQVKAVLEGINIHYKNTVKARNA